MITLLNTSVLTTFGTYEYKPISLEAARALVAGGVNSAIGHQATAEFLTELFGVKVEANRWEYLQKPGEEALIFKLNSRVPAGAMLTRQEVEKCGYTLGILRRLA